MSFAEAGYEYLPGIFSPDTVSVLAKAVAQSPIDSSRSWKGPWLDTGQQAHLGICANIHKQKDWQDAISQPVFQEHLQRIFPGGQCIRSMAIIKPAKTGQPFPWHQDSAYYGEGYSRMLIATVYLDDVSDSNGSIEFIPGSHVNGRLPHYRDGKAFLQSIAALNEPIRIQAKAGDVVLFDLYLVHGSKPNLSDKERRSVRLVFA